MTELEQYKKAYATLMGRVDRAISKMEETSARYLAQGLAEIMASEELKAALEDGAVFYAEDEVLRKKTGRVFLHNE